VLILFRDGLLASTGHIAAYARFQFREGGRCRPRIVISSSFSGMVFPSVVVRKNLSGVRQPLRFMMPLIAGFCPGLDPVRPQGAASVGVFAAARVGGQRGHVVFAALPRMIEHPAGNGLGDAVFRHVLDRFLAAEHIVKDDADIDFL